MAFKTYGKAAEDNSYLSLLLEPVFICLLRGELALKEPTPAISWHRNAATRLKNRFARTFRFQFSLAKPKGKPALTNFN